MGQSRPWVVDDPTLRDGRGSVAAHTRDSSGATPDPATTPYRTASTRDDGEKDGRLAFLQDLSEWMRGAGATRARLPDGTELELGDRPPTSPPKDTPEQIRARERAALREDLETRYAHVGGWNGSDDELDTLLNARGA